jgi:hypothetical protein
MQLSYSIAYQEYSLLEYEQIWQQNEEDGRKRPFACHAGHPYILHKILRFQKNIFSFTKRSNSAKLRGLMF